MGTLHIRSTTSSRGGDGGAVVCREISGKNNLNLRIADHIYMTSVILNFFVKTLCATVDRNVTNGRVVITPPRRVGYRSGANHKSGGI